MLQTPTNELQKHAAATTIVLIGAFLFMLYAIALGLASVLVPIAQIGRKRCSGPILLGAT